MNKLITLLAEIEQISSNSNSVIHDLSIQALERSRNILKTLSPTNHESYFNDFVNTYDKHIE